MELEVSQHLQAERYEHTPERTGQRNGYRERQWDARCWHDRVAGAESA